MIVDMGIHKGEDMMTWDQVVVTRVGPAIMETVAMAEIVNTTIPATGARATREVRVMTADEGQRIREGQAEEATVSPGTANMMMIAEDGTGNTSRRVKFKIIDMKAD